MKKNIEIEDTGLQCDNCDWKDKSITFDIYKNWIDKPCPKCGENVLTEEDYTNAETLRNAIDILNSLSPDELEAMNKLAIESGIDYKNLPFLKDSIGLENLDKDEPVIVKVQTHKDLKVTVIKNDGESANN